MSNTTWRECLQTEFNEHGDSFASIESITLTDAQLDAPFDNGFGGVEGCAFTVWTAKRVYFPVMYDGAEWVESVSRHPDGQPTDHVGG